MKINNELDFGKMVRERRRELGYTQRYVAEVTGFSTSFISELENGKATAELGRAIRLANLMGLDLLLNRRE